MKIKNGGMQATVLLTYYINFIKIRLSMNRKEIIKKIEYIRINVRKDSCKIIEEKSYKRKFKIFSPNRFKFLSKIIKKIRGRLVSEIAHILEPELDKQQEINLRLLKEIEEIKKSIS